MRTGGLLRISPPFLIKSMDIDKEYNKIISRNKNIKFRPYNQAAANELTLMLRVDLICEGGWYSIYFSYEMLEDTEFIDKELNNYVQRKI